MIDRTGTTIDDHEEGDEEISEKVAKDTIPDSDTVLIDVRQALIHMIPNGRLTDKNVPPLNQLATVPTAENQNIAERV